MTATEKKGLIGKLEIALSKIEICSLRLSHGGALAPPLEVLHLHLSAAKGSLTKAVAALNACAPSSVIRQGSLPQLPPLDALEEGSSEDELTEPDAAKLLGVSLGALQRWRRDGRAPAHTWLRGNRGLRYKRSDIESWKKSKLRHVPTAFDREAEEEAETARYLASPEGQAEIEKERIWQETHNKHNLGMPDEPSIEVPIVDEDDPQPEGFRGGDEIDDE